MGTKTVVTVAVLLIFIAGQATTKAPAQDSNSSKAPSEPTFSAYHLEFSMNEIEDGKKINTRQYSMNLKADDAEELKIGTRVPVEVKQGEFQYLDVGTNIWARVNEGTNGVLITVHAENSSFAVPEQENQTGRPVRQLQIRSSSVVQLGKPQVVGSVDDPNSKRQFQLEVSVTKLK